MSDTARLGRPKLAELVERRTGKKFEDLLQQYVAERETLETMAAAMGCSVDGLRKHADKLGFELVRTFRQKRPHA